VEKFELIEHTADIGIRVAGKTYEELFTNAAIGLFSMLVMKSGSGRAAKTVKIKADTIEDLLVVWLNELIGLFYVDKFLPLTFKLSIHTAKDAKLLSASLFGRRFDPCQGKVNMEIKAATYHNVKFEKKESGFQAEVIFDI